MLDRTSAKLLPLATRAADVAPAVPACCNACRTCVTTNALGLLTAGGAAAVSFVTRALRRQPDERVVELDETVRP